jgi:hypothetical protein
MYLGFALSVIISTLHIPGGEGVYQGPLFYRQSNTTASIKEVIRILHVSAAPYILNSQPGSDNSIHIHHFDVISSALYRNSVLVPGSIVSSQLSNLHCVILHSNAWRPSFPTARLPVRRPRIGRVPLSQSRDICLVNRIGSRRLQYWIRG